jgi:ERCC4-related helicase
VITDLHIAHIEVRTEDDPSLAPYTHNKPVSFMHCPTPANSNNINAMLKAEIHQVMQPYVNKLYEHSILLNQEAEGVSKLVMDEVERYCYCSSGPGD